MKQFLSTLVSRFIDEAISAQQGLASIDREGIRAVCSGSTTPGQVDALSRWLNTYKVARRVPKQLRRSILKRLQNMPDLPASRGPKLHGLAERYDDLAEFLRLHKDTTEMSATSKLLWLRYPNDAPLYDAYACRVAGIFANWTRAEGNSYEAYANLIYDLFDGVHDRLQISAQRVGYEYPIRLLDKVLWYAGRPRFNR